MATSSAGAGTKGERLHDWAYVELADLDGGEYNKALTGQTWTRGLLIRRKIADGDLAFFTTWAPQETTIERLAKIEGHRWAIEDSFEAAKNELGLDHNETRSWHGWRRHVSLVMLAFAMMASIRVHANAISPPPKTMRRKTKTPPDLRTNEPRASAGRCRKSAASPRALHESESTGVRYRLVALAKSPSSRSKARSHKIATVMLGPRPIKWLAHGPVVIYGFRKEAPMILEQFWLTDAQFSKVAPHLPTDTRGRRGSMTAV